MTASVSAKRLVSFHESTAFGNRVKIDILSLVEDRSLTASRKRPSALQKALTRVQLSKLLTDSAYYGSSPKWFSDGTSFASPQRRTARLRIYLMNANGAGQKRLTLTEVQTAYPHWGKEAKPELE